MRASRLLAILTTLQARGQVTAQTLADECEVSLRTVYRDIDALSAAGIPVYSIQGNGGGYRLLGGYRVRLNGMTAAEVETLLPSGLSRQTAALGLADATARARAKLLAALPEDLRSGARHARFHVDAPSWFAEPETTADLPLLAEAVRRQREVAMHYRGRSGERDRVVEPLGIVLKAGKWYVVARSGQETRTFRLARIAGVTVLDATFTYPDGFDLEAYWTESTLRFERDLHPMSALVRLSPRGIAMMDELLPPYVSRGAAVSEVADAEGWWQVTLSIGAVERAAGELLRFGTEIEVVGPPPLRARMAEIAGALVRVYAAPSDQSGGSSDSD